MKNKLVRLLTVCISVVFLYSCDKKGETISTEKEEIELDLDKVEVGINTLSSGEDLENLKSSSKGNMQSKPQIVSGKFGDEIIEAELSVNNSVNTAYISEEIKSSKLSASTKAATPSIANVADSVMYRLSVYKTTDGSLVEHKIYKRGAKSGPYSETNKFKLTKGINYTFVCYSINSATTIPALPNNPNDNLNTAKIIGGDVTVPGIDGGTDFMYWTLSKLITENTNLDILLNHRFTKLTIIVKAPTGGKLWFKFNATSNDSLGRILPFNNRMTTFMKTGLFTGGNVLPINAPGKTIFYGDFSAVAQFTTNPAVFYTGTTAPVTNGSIFLPNVSLKKSGGLTTKKNMTVTGLTFAPRTNYTLTVNIK